MSRHSNRTQIRRKPRRTNPSVLHVLATEAPGLLAFSGGALALLTVGALIVGSVT
ncbi:hypothetical protein JQC91_01980 [Jannaschia sp. Os4]|uniref:hypothetical protein n=1 Tax=Jannaschia sp. Os4 TaxID=2807617 RepID=UPI001939509D|nr:hypothetical protein [Jannaschia sp. Os4]MBM2575062.1 hypothetical protein [Jannaschia sp. Os4]